MNKIRKLISDVYQYIDNNRVTVGLILIVLNLAIGLNLLLLLHLRQPAEIGSIESIRRRLDEINKELAETVNQLDKNSAEIAALGQSKDSQPAAPLTAVTESSSAQQKQTIATETGRVAGAKTEAAAPLPSLINLNAATLSQLDSLPGIGPSYAQRIIEYRDSNGGFKTIEEVKQVKGIGEKTFEKFKDKITVQ